MFLVDEIDIRVSSLSEQLYRIKSDYIFVFRISSDFVGLDSNSNPIQSSSFFKLNVNYPVIHLHDHSIRN